MPKTGPKPTPTNLKILRGNPGKRPIDPTSEPDFGTCVPDPPLELSGQAREEWDRIAPMLAAQRVLSGPDMAMLSIYCSAFARWRASERALAKAAQADPDSEGLVQGGSINPYLRVQKEAIEQMHKACVEFGMTPAARTRVKVAEKAPANKFGNNGTQKKK